MAKYKLTITYLETGEVLQECRCDGVVGVTSSCGSGVQMALSIWDMLSELDKLNMLTALENQIKTLENSME